MDLIKLAYISDEDFIKTTLSSGDWQPGFYRFTLGDRDEEDGQLTIPGLISAIFGGANHDWFEFTRKRLATSVDERNRDREDIAVYNLINQQYRDWMLTGKEYDIAVIEIDNGAREIELNKNYVLMGILVRFTETHFQIGYDLLRDEALLSIPYDYPSIRDYCYTIYGDHLHDFFLPADVVACLDVETNKVEATDLTVERLVTAHSNSILYASNRTRAGDLPMRWAKDIMLTNPC